MQLTTPVRIGPLENPLSLTHPFLSLGSCFADRIGNELRNSFLDVTVNPGGVLYNPISLAGSLAAEERRPRLFLHQGLWRSLEHHSQVSDLDAEGALAEVLGSEETRTRALREASTLLITLGTARVFRLVNNRRVVVNCHRLPQSLFQSDLLSVSDTVSALLQPLHTWLERDPERQVILTVSPIRHLRPGLVENNRSKATLLLASEELTRQHQRIQYFPAFEIMVDELRDYRFYDDRMVQPTQQATEFVWQRFQNACFTQEARESLKLCCKLRLLFNHRPGPRTERKVMAEKGLSYLKVLDAAIPAAQTELLRAKFQNWLVDEGCPSV